MLNTPTLRSMKWWPGGLGKTACFCMLYAQLIIDGKELGFHCFIIQLRDENHQPMKGVEVLSHHRHHRTTALFFSGQRSVSGVMFLFFSFQISPNGKVGEVGPKIGDNGTETGFLRLFDVRIPRSVCCSIFPFTPVLYLPVLTWKLVASSPSSREWMMMKNQVVTAEGKYIKSSKEAGKNQYGTMLQIRAGLVMGAGYASRHSSPVSFGIFLSHTEAVSYRMCSLSNLF